MSADDLGLAEKIKHLTAPQRGLIQEVIAALSREVKVVRGDGSDLATSEFVDSITNRLLLHHATTEEKFNKKSFEYALKSAFCASHISAKISDSQTSQGADLVVEGTRFSLKTEAAEGIRESKLTISKLMEARWIRECRTKADFAKGINERVLPALAQLDRILVLRAFDRPENLVEYELVEIPLGVLQAMGDVRPRDFSPRTRNGSSSATVIYRATRAFRLVLDGSVEKITVSRLEKSLCQVHCTWEIPNSAS
jgi:hypothetical protein